MVYFCANGVEWLNFRHDVLALHWEKPASAGRKSGHFAGSLNRAWQWLAD
jgi:hypothetical protein